MCVLVARAARVGDEQALEAAVVRLAHRAVDADVGRRARDQQRADPAGRQDRREIGAPEGAVGALVDDELAGQRLQLGNDLEAGLAADQEAAERPGLADCRRSLSDPGHPVRRQLREVGAVALAGEDHRHPCPARRLEQAARGLDCGADAVEAVAHRS